MSVFAGLFCSFKKSTRKRSLNISLYLQKADKKDGKKIRGGSKWGDGI